MLHERNPSRDWQPNQRSLACSLTRADDGALPVGIREM